MKALLALSLIGTAAVWAQAPVRKVTRAEAINAVATRVQPQYPLMARQLRLEGTVELEAIISEAGAVEEVTIVSGTPVLTKPAADALRKWKFTPFLQDGKPVRAQAPITIVFKKEQ